MLRDLLHEIVRRRLWPIPVLALLIALAAPLLFLKSAPVGAPTALPAPTATGELLPPHAQRLLATSDADGARGRATGSSHDPFEPPASSRAAAAARARDAKGSSPSSSDSSAGDSSTEPIPVVIQNPNGSSPKSDSSSSSTPSAPSSGDSGSRSTPASTRSARTASVDVRFGERADSRIQRSIPLLQTFFIHGKVAAVFVKYSPSRNKAVFAMAPGIGITGPVKCRRKDGVCRYLDIPAGSYARLTMLTADGTIVRRRLDVASIDRGRASAGTTASAAKDDGYSACLLRKLQTQKLGAAPVDRDACER